MATFSRTVTVDWSGPIMEGKGQVKATVEGQVAAEGTISFALVDLRESPPG